MSNDKRYPIDINLDDIEDTVIIIIDTETTIRGENKELLSDYENPRLCELAFSVIKNGEYTHKTLFCDPGMPIPLIASATNGIVDSDVKGAIPYKDAQQKFKVFVDTYIAKGVKVYLVAHNAKYDAKVLDIDIDDYPWICTYRLAKLLYPESEKHTNSYLRHLLKVDNEVDNLPRIPHRALDDTLITQANFTHMINDVRMKMSENIGVEPSEICFSSDDLINFANSPIEVLRLPFGKYKGKYISEMKSPDEIKYIVETLNKDFVDDDLKATLFYHLGSNTYGLNQEILDLFVGDNSDLDPEPIPMSVIL